MTALTPLCRPPDSTALQVTVPTAAVTAGPLRGSPASTGHPAPRSQSDHKQHIRPVLALRTWRPSRGDPRSAWMAAPAPSPTGRGLCTCRPGLGPASPFRCPASPPGRGCPALTPGLLVPKEQISGLLPTPRCLLPAAPAWRGPQCPGRVAAAPARLHVPCGSWRVRPGTAGSGC